MDKPVDIAKVLRTATKALQRAERALLKMEQQPTATPAVTEAPEAKLPPAARALYTYLTKAAQKRKAYEEQDSTAFAAVLAEPDVPDLLPLVLDRMTYQISPTSRAAVRHDAVPAATQFEQLLKVMGATGGGGTQAADVLRPYLADMTLKHWADLKPDRDLIVVKYETPASVDHVLARAELGPLMESVQREPGSLQLVEGLLATNGVAWDALAGGGVNNVLTLKNVAAKWAAVIDLFAVAATIASKLATVTAVRTPANVGWWDATRTSLSLPPPLLDLVRARLPRVFVQKSAVPDILRWAATLPSWSQVKAASGACPLLIQNVAAEDILAK